MIRNVFIVLVAGLALLAVDVGMIPAQEQDRRVAESPTEICPIPVGSVLPAISLLTPEGQEFDLNRAVTANPVVLIYYRGGW